MKCHLQSNSKFDKVLGLEDYGDKRRTSRLGTTAMNIMVQGIDGKPWSYPLAYFFVRGSSKWNVVKKYILEAISQLQNLELVPYHLVCDQGTKLQKLANLLGVSMSRPVF